MKRFVGCPQISRLKTERNYWDDAAGGIKASTASRLWQRGVRGGTDQGCRMPAALRAAGSCGEMLHHHLSEDVLEADAPRPQLSGIFSPEPWAEMERGGRGWEVTFLVARSREMRDGLYCGSAAVA